jgi:hypothetical protein
MKPGGQTARLYAYLRANPGASSLEIIRDLSVTNATGRISDLRDVGEREGFVVLRERRKDGRWGYVIAPREPLTLFGLAS